MFGIFKKKPTINSITIPHENCDVSKSEKQIKQWISKEYPAALSVNFFPIEPDIPTIKNIDTLRNFYRRTTALSGTGIIEIELDELDGVPCIKTIFKVPQKPTGWYT